MQVIYVDLETTGLDPKTHQIVEVAWARETGPIQRFVPAHDLYGATSEALEVNRYYERGLDKATQVDWTSGAVKNFYEALQGSTIVGSSPSFDIRFLYEQWGTEPWYHKLFDITCYTAGIFGWEAPQSLKKTIDHMNSLGFGLPTPDHTAAGDVNACRELHVALKKMAEIRRFVDDTSTAHEILIANNPDHLGTSLIVQEVWRRNKKRKRRNY